MGAKQRQALVCWGWSRNRPWSLCNDQKKPGAKKMIATKMIGAKRSD